MIGTEVYLVLMFASAIAAGLLGSMCGFGGGVLLTPILTLGFGIPVQFAIGASVVSVIGTSCGSGSAFVKDRIANLKIGTLLNTATTAGAAAGAVTTIFLITSGLKWLIFVIFGVILLVSALDFGVKARHEKSTPGAGVAGDLQGTTVARPSLSGQYYDAALKQTVPYSASRPAGGTILALFAGLLSGLLGIGGGTLNVLIMNLGMKVPFKVSTTTSNFMIGVTAAASASIFYLSGYIDLLIVGPVAIGVVAGSFIGARALVRTRPSALRLLFVAILVVAGFEMLQKGAILI